MVSPLGKLEKVARERRVWAMGDRMSCCGEESVWAGNISIVFLLEFLRVLVTSDGKIKFEMGSFSCNTGIILDNVSKKKAEMEGKGCNPHVVTSFWLYQKKILN